MRKQIFLTSIAGITIFAAFIGGCGGTVTNTTNSNRIGINTANANIANVNTPPVVNSNTAASGSKIETGEPNEYSATLRLTAATTGKNTSLPLTANVAREGENRRVAFNLPNNEQVVYLNLGNTRYLILPNRKQYAELSPGAVGFDIPRLMMPDQIVEYLKGREGYERVGEEQINGRTIIKYRAWGTTQTNTPAGQVNAESFTFVDKETGLPLRAEFESQAAGSVQGVDGLKAIVEMRDIKTETAPSLFEVPEGYNRITEEQVRSQVSAVMQAVSAIAGSFVNNMNNPKPTASPK